MTIFQGRPEAEVISVHPNCIKIRVFDIHAFRRKNGSKDENALRVGSYLKIIGDDGGGILAMIDNFTLQPTDDGKGIHIIEASPIGFLNENDKFTRGVARISIPPAGVEPASSEVINKIFGDIATEKKFEFANLSSSASTAVPVDGDRFFNKHVAIVGSTGSGKSHTLAAILQRAVSEKNKGYSGLNNSHIIIFDIHGEYRSAFPSANILDVDNLRLPFWLMNSEELEELLIDSGENQAYNQVSLIRRLIRLNKISHGSNTSVTVDTPCFFRIDEVICALENLNREQIVSENPNSISLKTGDQNFSSDDDKWTQYFLKKFEFESKSKGTRRGPFSELERLISRLGSKVNDPRLSFLFGSTYPQSGLEDALRQILGFKRDNESNITIFDLSGIPFEALSLTVSLVSRLVFDFSYHLKRELSSAADDAAFNQAPVLLVYEEAHKYVPKTTDARYRACRQSIERIAKEGRKYGTTLAIVSQRPSEISETIFSQCNNFIAMRLTNPDDQSYVRRLLPDSLGPLIEALPTLPQGDALLIGDSVVMPSQVTIQRCYPEPNSDDIRYLQEWKKEWLNIEFLKIAARWLKR